LNVKHLVLALMIAVSASGATAQDDPTMGKKVGDRMAPSLSAADQDDKPQHLQSLMGRMD